MYTSMIKIAKLNERPEIFYSIQGEGKNIGTPSVFIRSALCNLHCIWCDTPYTWNWGKYNKDDMILNLTPEQIVCEVKRYNCKNIVITGGEPFLQQEEFLNVIKLLRENDNRYFFEIETNGTIKPLQEFDQYINQYNVSPKLANGGDPLELRERPDVYEFFRNNHKAYFKFVMVNKNDLNEVIALVEKYRLSKERIFLMPEGTSDKEIGERRLWIIETCKQLGFRYTDRLHIQLYGSKRGV